MTRRIVAVEFSVNTQHHILDTDLETNRLRDEEYAKAVDTQQNAEQIVTAHYHPALSDFAHQPFSDAKIDEADTVWVRFADPVVPQFTEKQLYILEAALRYSLDQANDSDIMILDWGDGANQQLSEEAYKQVDMSGVHVVSEEKIVSETLLLLGDALASVQHAKDAI